MKVIVVLADTAYRFKMAVDNWSKPNTSEHLSFVCANSLKDVCGLRPDAYIKLGPPLKDEKAIMKYLGFSKPALITDELLRYTDPKIIEIFLNDRK